MKPLEQAFVCSINNVSIQSALEFECPQDLPNFLEKIKNSTAGLYLKSDGFNCNS